MSDMRLVGSIINFLQNECQRTELTADSRESLEVAVQCLQTAYDLKAEDLVLPQMQTSRTLVDIFSKAMELEPVVKTEITEGERVLAEAYKVSGNNLMRTEKYSEAVDSYTKAINVDRSNAVYYCNRAAGYSRMFNFQAAIADCKQAIVLDPNYSKAYGRMGLAYVSLNQNAEAIECYKKAIDIDPTNESYQVNLKLAQENLIKQDQSSNPVGGSAVDVNDLFNNPVLRNMATTMMQDPNMFNVLSGLASSSVNERGMDALLRAGQQFAAQMQASNPQLIEQLRQQILGNSNSCNPDTKDQPQPPN